MDSAITTPEHDSTQDQAEIARIAGMLKSRNAALTDLRKLRNMRKRASDVAVAASNVGLFDDAIAPAMSQREICDRVIRRLIAGAALRGWKI